jgi:hypothetical protein
MILAIMFVVGLWAYHAIHDRDVCGQEQEAT